MSDRKWSGERKRRKECRALGNFASIGGWFDVVVTVLGISTKFSCVESGRYWDC